MNKNEYKFLKIIALFILLMIMLVTLTGCSKKQTNENQLQKKVAEEIRYVNEEIISMMNSLNNITLRNYTVVTQEEAQTENEKTAQGSVESSKSESSGSSSGSQSGGKSEQAQGDSKQEETAEGYEISKNSILTNSKEPNWATIKESIEKFYSSWSTIVLDLYALNIPKEDIIGFSNQLNTCVTNIKAEDKTKSMDSLATLYGYLPKYANYTANDQGLTNKLNVKFNLLEAYRLIEQEKWEEIKTNLAKAEESYLKLMDQSSGKPKEYTANKGYILLKEFQNAVEGKDKDVLYIKYKSTIEELKSFS